MKNKLLRKIKRFKGLFVAVIAKLSFDALKRLK